MRTRYWVHVVHLVVWFFAFWLYRVPAHELLHCWFFMLRSGAESCVVVYARPGGWLRDYAGAKGVALVSAIPWWEHPVIYLAELGPLLVLGVAVVVRLRAALESGS